MDITSQPKLQFKWFFLQCSYLINLDFDQFSCSVLVYFSFFDPRPWPKGLLLMFEFDFQVEEANALRRLIQVD